VAKRQGFKALSQKALYRAFYRPFKASKAIETLIGL